MNSSLTLQRQKQQVGGGDGFIGAVIGDGFPGRIVEPDPTQVVFYDGKPYSYVSGGSGKSGVYPYCRVEFPFEWCLSIPRGNQRRRICQIPAGLSIRADWSTRRRRFLRQHLMEQFEPCCWNR